MRTAVLLLASAIACGSAPSPGGHPVATLATSTDASKGIAEIRLAWDAMPAQGPQPVRLKIERFIARYPNEPVTVIARLYLINALLEEHDITDAIEEMERVPRRMPEGNTSDFAIVTRARLLRLQRHPDQALELLRPLQGRVVDAHVQALLCEELALSALESGRQFEAIAFLDAWLKATPETTHTAVSHRIRKTVESLEPYTLEQSLRAMRAAGPSSGYTVELQKMIADRLGKVAVDTGDTKLAQWLLSSGLQSETANDGTQGLHDLATSNRGRRAVTGHMIGMVLPTATSAFRDASADAARGAAFALGLPRTSATEDDGTRLVSRTDPGGDGLEAALEELAGEGAAVILAGFDEDGSERARSWSEANGTPVITLGVPREKPIKFSFVAGERHSHGLTLLYDALTAAKITKAASVIGNVGISLTDLVAPASLVLIPPSSCEAKPGELHDRFPIADWQKQGAQAFLAAGNDVCARALINSLSAAKKPTIALGLEASSAIDTKAAVHLYAVATGKFPVDATSTDARITAYQKQFGATPTWWTAIGHDAALIARKAITDLPRDTTTASTEVTRRRDTARAGLETAKVSLWTTDAESFDNHILSRTLKLVEKK